MASLALQSSPGAQGHCCSDHSHCPSHFLPRCRHGLGPRQPLPGEPAAATDAEPAAGEPSARGQRILWAQPRRGACGLHDLRGLPPSLGGQQLLPAAAGPCCDEHGGQPGRTPVSNSGHWHNQPVPPLVPGRDQCRASMPRTPSRDCCLWKGSGSRGMGVMVSRLAS